MWCSFLRPPFLFANRLITYSRCTMVSTRSNLEAHLDLVVLILKIRFTPNRWTGGGYLKVHQQVGSLIDWYNIQFYNRKYSCHIITIPLGLNVFTCPVLQRVLPNTQTALASSAPHPQHGRNPPSLRLRLAVCRFRRLLLESLLRRATRATGSSQPRLLLAAWLMRRTLVGVSTPPFLHSDIFVLSLLSSPLLLFSSLCAFLGLLGNLPSLSSRTDGCVAD